MARRTTILGDEHILLEAKHLARQQGKTFTAVVHEALGEYIQQHRAAARHLSLVGIGASNLPPLAAEEMDDFIRGGIDSAAGWSPRRRSEGIPPPNPEP